MINTVFYFPSSIDEYNAATVDPRTICFVPNANGNGSIYKGGKKFGGADISDVVTAIQQYMEQHPAHDYSADVESLQNDITAMSATLRGLSSINKEGIQTMFKKGFATYKEMIESFESTGDQTYKDYTFGKEDFEEWASEMGIVVPQGNGYYQVGWSRLSQNVSEIRATVTQMGYTINNMSQNPATGEVDVEQLSADLYAYIQDNAANAGIQSTWGRYVARDEENIQLLESMASTVQTYADNDVTFGALLSAANDYRTGQGSIAGIISRVGTVESDINGINNQLGGIGNMVDGKIATAMVGMVVTDDLDDYVPRASIIAAINESGESNVTIDANKINIGGIQIQSSQVSGINQLIANTILATDIQASKVSCQINGVDKEWWAGDVGFHGKLYRTSQVDTGGMIVSAAIGTLEDGSDNIFSGVEKQIISISEEGIKYNTYSTLSASANYDETYGTIVYNTDGQSPDSSWSISGSRNMVLDANDYIVTKVPVNAHEGIEFSAVVANPSGGWVSNSRQTLGEISLQTTEEHYTDEEEGDEVVYTHSQLNINSDEKIKISAPTIEFNGTAISGNNGETDIYIYATPTGGSTPAKYKLNLQKLIQDGYLVAV